jgi:hypothetical protein
MVLLLLLVLVLLPVITATIATTSLVQPADPPSPPRAHTRTPLPVTFHRTTCAPAHHTHPRTHGHAMQCRPWELTAPLQHLGIAEAYVLSLSLSLSLHHGFLHEPGFCHVLGGVRLSSRVFFVRRGYSVPGLCVCVCVCALGCLWVQSCRQHNALYLLPHS